MRLACYLDDILILSASPQQAAHDRELVLQSLQNHGFTLNSPKSHLCPTTRILHLRATIDSVLCQVFLCPDRKNNIQQLVSHVLLRKTVPLLLLSQLLGKLISCINIVPWARFHLRRLQWFLLPFQKQGRAES